MEIVNEDYTTNTITYALHSNKALSGRSNNCWFNMGNYLRREYDYYILQPLSFISAVPSVESFCLEIADIGFSYNTDGINNFIPICNANNTSARISARAELNYRHMIQNWNGKLVNFRYRDIRTNMPPTTDNELWGTWCLLLALTPVYDRPREQTVSYIHTRQYESFSYFVSSVNRITGDQYEYEIFFPIISDNYSEYFFQRNCLILDYKKMTFGNSGSRYFGVCCENLFSNGYGGVPMSSKYILGYVNGTPNQPLMLPELCPSGDYYCGVIRDMKQPRRVKYTYHDVYLDKITNGVDATYTLGINFLVTPIRS